MVHLVPEDLDGISWDIMGMSWEYYGMLWECYGNVMGMLWDMDPPNDQEAGQILSIEDLLHIG
jgi:hypothetical protein